MPSWKKCFLKSIPLMPGLFISLWRLRLLAFMTIMKSSTSPWIWVLLKWVVCKKEILTSKSSLIFVHYYCWMCNSYKKLTNRLLFLFAEKVGNPWVHRCIAVCCRYAAHVFKLLQIQSTCPWGCGHGKETPGMWFRCISYFLKPFVVFISCL